MPRRAGLVLAFLLAAFCATAGARGEAPQVRTLRVGVFESPPFVELGQQDARGMAVELWRNVAATLGVETRIVTYDGVAGLLEAARDGAVDVAVADLSITEHRLQHVQFTYPWQRTGLRVLVPDEGRVGWAEVWASLLADGHVRTYAIGLLLVLFVSLLLTVVERRVNDEFPTGWWAGLAESVTHVVSVAARGWTTHRPMFGTFGRLLASLWMVVGIGTVAYVTSSLTAALTTTRAARQVEGVADLGGLRVGVVAASTGEDYASEHALDYASYPDLDAALAALRNGTVKALVGDDAALAFRAAKTGADAYRLVGTPFRTRQEAFAVPLGSPYLHDINKALLRAQETGVLERIRRKYLGRHARQA